MSNMPKLSRRDSRSIQSNPPVTHECPHTCEIPNMFKHATPKSSTRVGAKYLRVFTSLPMYHYFSAKMYPKMAIFPQTICILDLLGQQ